MRTHIVAIALVPSLALAACSSAEMKPDAPVTHEQAGAPAEAPEALIVPPEAGPLYFGFDEHLLSDDSRANLGEIAAYMKQKPAVRLTIDGHCDSLGTSEYNLALGDKRARAAQRYLTALGVEEERVKVVSWGEERPVVENSDEAARARNRRDEFTLYVLGDATASLDDLSALDVVMAWRDWE